MAEERIWANALLKDGKIMFWWTGNKRLYRFGHFSKSFYYTGISLRDEIMNSTYTVESAMMDGRGQDGYKEAIEWYRRYEISPDSKGLPAYEER